MADIYQFTQGLEEFSRQLGDYPPDFHDAKSSEAFLRQTFPACPPENYPDLSNQSPALALYFWLAGPKGNGLSANPKNPFDSGSRRIGPFCQFKSLQLREVNGAMHYFPLCNLRGGAWTSISGAARTATTAIPASRPHPYRHSRDGTWINSDSYQIIFAGQDGDFARATTTPPATITTRPTSTTSPISPADRWANGCGPDSSNMAPSGLRAGDRGPRSPRSDRPRPLQRPIANPPGDHPRFELIILPDRK